MPAAYVDDEQTVMMSAPPASVLDDAEPSARVFEPGAPSTPLFSEDTTHEATELGPPPDLEEPTRIPPPVGEARVLPSILPAPIDEAEAVRARGRPRAIRERVRTDARRREEERFSPETLRDAPAAPPFEPTRVPEPPPRGEGISVYLLGGLIFGAAAVVVVVLLLA
jgi:hypothetical protein